MPQRHAPVRPDLEQLRHQAKDLLRAIHAGDPDALADLRAYHHHMADPAAARLADAQLVLARSYGSTSWPRLVQACELVDAIWRDDVDAVRALVAANPQLVHEDAGPRNRNWGPPMSYAANLGRDAIIDALLALGATDLERAIDRATLQGQVATARRLHERMGAPIPPADALGSPAYTLSVAGTQFLLDCGARVVDDEGRCIAPVAVVLESDSRRPAAKHAILELYATHGVQFPDTPAMAFHRGRIDLLERHLARDPDLLRRTFTHDEIWPAAFGCRDEIETQGTPLAGTTLLHLCVDWDELAIAEWLLARGMPADARAAVDADGFGGHTALFGAVVCYANFWRNYRREPLDESPFAQLLLAHGADPNVRATLRKTRFLDGRHPREYRDVTPLAWGDRYEERILVSATAMRMIAQAGGVR